MKRFRNLATLSVAVIALYGCGNNDTPQAGGACVESDTLAQSNQCFSATVLYTGNAFPNPVLVGNEQSLSMKIAGVGAQPFAPLTAEISTQVTSISGQLVDQQVVGNVNSDPNFVPVTIWRPSPELATGQYILGVTVDLGVCGSKTICLDNISQVNR